MKFSTLVIAVAISFLIGMFTMQINEGQKPLTAEEDINDDIYSLRITIKYTHNPKAKINTPSPAITEYEKDHARGGDLLAVGKLSFNGQEFEPANLRNLNQELKRLTPNHIDRIIQVIALPGVNSWQADEYKIKSLTTRVVGVDEIDILARLAPTNATVITKPLDFHVIVHILCHQTRFPRNIELPKEKK